MSSDWNNGINRGFQGGSVPNSNAGQRGHWEGQRQRQMADQKRKEENARRLRAQRMQEETRRQQAQQQEANRKRHQQHSPSSRPPPLSNPSTIGKPVAFGSHAADVAYVNYLVASRKEKALKRKALLRSLPGKVFKTLSIVFLFLILGFIVYLV